MYTYEHSTGHNIHQYRQLQTCSHVDVPCLGDAQSAQRFGWQHAVMTGISITFSAQGLLCSMSSSVEARLHLVPCHWSVLDLGLSLHFCKHFLVQFLLSELGLLCVGFAFPPPLSCFVQQLADFAPLGFCGLCHPAEPCLHNWKWL